MGSNGEKVAKARRWEWKRAENARRQSRYYLLLCLLLFAWIVGVVIIGWGQPPIYLFAISGFSIAYAIHFLSVSIGIQGVRLRQDLLSTGKEAIRGMIGDLERDVVGRGLGVLGGGLGILVSGGLLLLAKSADCKIPGTICNIGVRISYALALFIYLVAGLCLVFNVVMYYFCNRGDRSYPLRQWPREIERILKDGLEDASPTPR